MNNIKTVYRVARKEHHCDLCGEVILPKEKYRRDTLVYDGRVFDFASHCDCDDLTKELKMFDQVASFSDGLDERLFSSLVWDKVSEYLPYEAACRMTVHEQVKYIMERLGKKENLVDQE